MTHDPREALKPCPFCGGEAKIFSYRTSEDSEGVHVECIKCGVRTDATDDAYADRLTAVSMWNTRALTASPGKQKPFGWLGRDGKFSLPVEMTRERFLSHFHDTPVGTPVIPLYTSAPGEQEPCGWQFCCPDGKWIGCDEPPANELRDEPEKFRRVYLSPPPAAGWNGGKNHD